MKIKIPYGKTYKELVLNPTDIKGVIECACDNSPCDEAETVRSALGNPIASPRLSELAKTAQRIVVITSDHTRPVPSKITLPIILEEIRTGNPNADISILVATGVHRETTERELREKFGSDMIDRERFMVHDAFCKTNCRHIGALPSGCVCEVNNLVLEADLTVAEGFVEPHFFAGFSGGRKSILPGVASARSIMSNHCSKLIADERSRTGVLDGNPIHKDMETAARLAGLRFIMNVVLNDDKEIIAAFAGDTVAAHQKACEYSRSVFERDCIKAKVVITSNGGYPLDQNIYQTVKSMTAAEECVDEGGVIICVSECIDGSGGEEFVRWFSESSGADDVLKKALSIDAEDTIGDQWQAQILARVMKKANIVLVSDIKNRTVIEKMGIHFCGELDEAVEYAKGLVKDFDGVVVIPNGISVIIKA